MTHHLGFISLLCLQQRNLGLSNKRRYSQVRTFTGQWTASMVPSFIYESESCLVVSDSLRSHGLYSPWNSLGQNTGVGSLSIPYPGDLSNPGIELGSPALQADSLPTELWGKSSFIHILLFYKIIFLWNFPGNAVFKFLLFPLTLLLSAQAPLFNIANRAILLPACWFTECLRPRFLSFIPCW